MQWSPPNVNTFPTPVGCAFSMRVTFCRNDGEGVELPITQGWFRVCDESQHIAGHCPPADQTWEMVQGHAKALNDWIFERPAAREIRKVPDAVQQYASLFSVLRDRHFGQPYSVRQRYGAMADEDVRAEFDSLKQSIIEQYGVPITNDLLRVLA